MPDQATHLLTRFRALDDEAAQQVGELLRTTATAVTSEPGKLSYDVFAVEDDPTTLYVLESWASAEHAQRHADLVLGNGGVDRVLPLLRERLHTTTLVPMAPPAPAADGDGCAV